MNPTGLTSDQVAAKIAAGKANHIRKKATTSTIPQIVLRSTLTVFNFVNLVLAVLILIVGSYKNLLFILIAIANTAISIVNEIRAKRTIDKMKLLAEQKPTVRRDGKTLQIPSDHLVEGDLLLLSLGNQILVDATVLSGQIEVNESYVTGEQDNITKNPGDKLISGSFVVSGSCEAEVTAVGADNFLTKLESSAKSIKPTKSKLFLIMNNIVKYISIALIPIGILLLVRQLSVQNAPANFHATDLGSFFNTIFTSPDIEVAITSTVAALINMIPEGLILLTSSVLALATIRLAKKQVLVQDLYSIETLARVDTICLDKTGTLTTGKMRVVDLVPNVYPVSSQPPSTPLKTSSQPSSDSSKPASAPNSTITTPSDSDPAYAASKDTLESALRAILSRSTADNATSAALREKLLKSAKFKARAQNAENSPSKSTLSALFDPTSPGVELIPFSSDRKYSGLRSADGEILMGALEFITKDPKIHAEAQTLLTAALSTDPDAKLAALDNRSSHVKISGHKEITPSASSGQTPKTQPRDPGNYRIISVIMRTKTAETLLGLAILEDELRPDASSIIKYFADNDIAVKIISGDNLSTVKTIAEKVGVKDAAAVDLSQEHRPSYAKLVKDYQIFTRVTPSQKKSLIRALKNQGNTVAMTGDGVNDILAMKEADCSIAIGEGADAARRAARLVLLGSDFSSVPQIIAEGRQTINNLERSTTLFLTKTIYASILAVLFVIFPLEYPYSPIEMTLLNVLCIGLPGLLLALETNTARIKDQFVRNIKKYSLPTGITVAITMLALALLDRFVHLSRPDLLTMSMVATFIIGISLIYRISRPLNPFRASLLVAIIAAFLIVVLTPLRTLFIL